MNSRPTDKQASYRVTWKGASLGFFTLEEIRAKVAGGEISLMYQVETDQGVLPVEELLEVYDRKSHAEAEALKASEEKARQTHIQREQQALITDYEQLLEQERAKQRDLELRLARGGSASRTPPPPPAPSSAHSPSKAPRLPGYDQPHGTTADFMFVKEEGEMQRSYSLDEVRSKWQDRMFAPNAQYWMQGMSQWEYLADYFSGRVNVSRRPPPPPSGRQPPPPPGRTRAGERYAFVKDPSALTKALIVMLWVQFGVVVLAIIGGLAQLELISRYEFTASEARANDEMIWFIALIYLCIAITTAILFLKWIYRANINSRGFGTKGMQFTPGWSVGCYFIPIWNLYGPFQSMCEIWKVSINPGNWTSQRVSAVLGWWWAFWLFAGLLSGLAGLSMLMAETKDEISAVTIFSIVSRCIELALITLAVSVVKQIHDNQSDLTDQSNSRNQYYG